MLRFALYRVFPVSRDEEIWACRPSSSEQNALEQAATAKNAMMTAEEKLAARNQLFEPKAAYAMITGELKKVPPCGKSRGPGLRLPCPSPRLNFCLCSFVARCCCAARCGV